MEASRRSCWKTPHFGSQCVVYISHTRLCSKVSSHAECSWSVLRGATEGGSSQEQQSWTQPAHVHAACWNTHWLLVDHEFTPRVVGFITFPSVFRQR